MYDKLTVFNKLSFLKENKLIVFAIFVASMVNFSFSFMGPSMAHMGPSIANDLVLTNIVQNWLPNASLLVIAVFSIPAGFIARKYGIRKCMIIGLFISLISCFGSLLANSGECLLFFRAVSGIGSSLAHVSAILFIVKFLSQEMWGRGFAVYTAFAYVALASAPSVSGFLVSNFGWRSIFYLLIPVFIFILLLSIFAIDRDWVISENTSFDLIGSVIYAIGLVLFIRGFTGLSFTLTFLGLCCLSCFVVHELRVESPIFKIELFKNLEFSTTIFADLFAHIGTFIIFTVFSYHLQYLLGYSAQNAGQILMLSPVVVIVVSIISGRLTSRNKVDPLKLSLIGLLFVSVVLVILSTLDANTPLKLIFLIMGLEGVGWGLFSPSISNAVMSSVSKEDSSHASSAISAFGSLGRTLSLSVFILSYSLVMGNAVIDSSKYGLVALSSHLACRISFVFCIITLVLLSYGVYKKRTKLTS